MLSDNDIAWASESLFEAEKVGRQIGLLSLNFPSMDMNDVYRIQNATVKKHKNAGRKQIGWKIGLTSKVMQNALGIDVPDSGVLFDDMLFTTGATAPKGRFIQPRVEAEIAFVMKSDVLGHSREAVLAATDFVSPSLEILDTRIFRTDPGSGKPRSILDTISDNAANAGIVLGNEKHKVDRFDLRWIGAILKRNGVVEETGLGAAVLDDPITSVQWLAERLAKYGRKISANHIVLSGSFIKVVEAPHGSHFCADFGDFGQVEITFE